MNAPNDSTGVLMMDDRHDVNATGRTLDDIRKDLEAAREAYRRGVFEYQQAWRESQPYDERRRMLSLQELYARMLNDAKACGLSVKAGAR